MWRGCVHADDEVEGMRFVICMFHEEEGYVAAHSLTLLQTSQRHGYWMDTVTIYMLANELE